MQKERQHKITSRTDKTHNRRFRPHLSLAEEGVLVWQQHHRHDLSVLDAVHVGAGLDREAVAARRDALLAPRPHADVVVIDADGNDVTVTIQRNRCFARSGFGPVGLKAAHFHLSDILGRVRNTVPHIAIRRLARYTAHAITLLSKPPLVCNSSSIQINLSRQGIDLRPKTQGTNRNYCKVRAIGVYCEHDQLSLES
jgi:hypothetical protein